jgi:DNA-binding transcriptional ArsR family regulator
MMPKDVPVSVLVEHAAEAAETLKLLANEQRLLLLCRMMEGEASVGELVDLTNMSQPSVSQHLNRLREGGMVTTRREGTTIYNRLADERVHRLIGMLCDRFGPKPPPHG